MTPLQIVAALRGGLVDGILPRESSYIGLSISRSLAIRLRVGLEWLVQSSMYRRQMKERLKSTRRLRSSATGVPAVILATGPSLSEVDIPALEQVQALGGRVFALNFFNETNIARQVKPDYYVLADPVFLVNWEYSTRIRRVWEYIQALETPTVFLPAHTDINQLPESCDFRYFNGLGLDGWSKNISPLRARGFLGLTAYHAISIALFLGHDPVFTAGVDKRLLHGWVTSWLAVRSVSIFGVECGPECKAMDTPHPDGFRTQARALVRSGQTVAQTAEDPGITDSCLYGWVKQDRIDRGEIEGVSRAESRELREEKGRIRELANEVEIHCRANALLGSSSLSRFLCKSVLAHG